MRTFLVSLLAFTVVAFATSFRPVSPEGEWISLFDGKTLNGWKAGEHAGTFTVTDGKIVVHGERAHLFYEGAVNNHTFKNFEFKVSVMTTPNANSGIFIHTEFQETGWPQKGYEIQVNNTHGDWRKTASIYAIQDVKEAPAKDNVWFTETIMVKGKTITIKINDKVVNEYTEPATGGKLSAGTFALQGHDPKSLVYYKDVMVKPLPD